MRAVTLEEAAALVGEPKLRWLGRGEDFHVFRAGPLLYRFPRRAECARWLETEGRLLPLLAPALPLQVPRVERAPARGPWRTRFARYRLVSGVPATRATRLDDTLPRALGAFLAALHAFPPQAARAAGVVDGSGTWAPELYREEAGAAWTAAPRTVPAALSRRVEGLLTGRTPPPPAAPGPLRLIHGDLEAEHVIVARATGRAVGVIDWGDTCLADAARDFAAFWAWRGRAFLETMLAAYPLPLDAGFRARVAFLGRLFAILDYVEAAEESPAQRAAALAQLERTFDPGQTLILSRRGSGVPGT